MATISASSSLDVHGIVSQLMQIEQRPLQSIRTTINGIQTKLSAWGRLQSAMSSFQDAARALARADTWSAGKASSSDEAALLATAGSGAIRGGYSIEVARLASRQTVASAAFADAAAVVGGGTLRIRMGSLDEAGTAFTPDSSRPEVAIDIADGATLADVRNAINAAGAGVSATLVADGSGQRLMLRSTDSGAAQAFSITVEDPDGGNTDGAGLSALAFDPAAAAGSGRNLQLTQAAQDALVTVNGLQVSAAGNRLEGVIENVTLELRRVTTAPVEVDVRSDDESLRASIEKFVKAYNELNSLIASQTAYNAETKTAGALQGNQTVTRIQQQLRETMRGTVGSDQANTLNALGIEFQRDGSLSIKDSKLKEALASPSMLKNFFAATGSEPGQQGIAQRLVTRLGDMLAADGTLSNATDALKARQRSAEQQQERLNARLNSIEQRLLRQYTALDANLAQLQGSLANMQSLIGSANINRNGNGN